MSTFKTGTKAWVVEFSNPHGEKYFDLYWSKEQAEQFMIDADDKLIEVKVIRKEQP